MKTKSCSKCKEEKPVEEFSKCARVKCGRQPKCKACNKLYRNQNAARISEAKKKCYASKRKQYLDQCRDYRKKNMTKYKAYMKIYTEKNKQKISLQKLTWKRNNIDRLRAKNREQQRYKLKTDELFAIKRRLRIRLYAAIRRNENNGSAVRALGCSVEYFKEYIESKFRDGMTWGNWGKVWHLDHIYPLAAANLRDRVEFLAVANWRNLQPLTVEENLEKADTVTPAAQRLFDSLCHELGTQEKVY